MQDQPHLPYWNSVFFKIELCSYSWAQLKIDQLVMHLTQFAIIIT